MSRTRTQDSPRRPRADRPELWTQDEMRAAYADHRDVEASVDAWIEDEIDRMIEE